MHKSRSVVKCFLGVRRTGSRAVLFVSPSGRMLRLLASIHTASVEPRTQVCPSRSEARESAYSAQCESFVWFLRALCKVRVLWIENLRVLWKAMRYRGPTHLVTCLHRVFVVRETDLPWPVRDSRTSNLLLTGGVLVTFLATEIRQKQHSDLVRTFISLSFDIEILC